MSITFTDNSSGLTDAKGFAVAAIGCDIREKGTDRLDLALICSAKPCTAAGALTRNDVKAAPVRVCREIIDGGKSVHGIVANSGNANACTGEQGLKDARDMAQRGATALKLSHNSIFVCSTGRIGRAMPMPRTLKGIDQAAAKLLTTSAEGTKAAEAILTSDTRPKTCSARFVWEGKTVTVAAMAKGAGMIPANMATMLAFLCTDIAAPAPLLHEVLRGGE